ESAEPPGDARPFAQGALDAPLDMKHATPLAPRAPQGRPGHADGERRRKPPAAGALDPGPDAEHRTLRALPQLAHFSRHAPRLLRKAARPKPESASRRTC